MKTTLTFETLRMPGADLGGCDPLPDIRNLPDIHSNIAFDDTIKPEESRYFNYGRVTSILPYRMQNQYNRHKTPKDYDCAVLENEYIRAVFMPQFGGKLYSLYDKVAKRHLLHVNPVFQPANLALRNAWISGGVEWNIGMTGHTPYTLSQLHTATLTMSDGTPVLRMYEWERIRQVSYQIDAYLPADSHFLMIRIRLKNTRNEEVPIYWWSNMAVDETPDTRVLAPADQAFCFDYSRMISKMDVPMLDGMDRSYTTRVPRSMDLFFDIPEKGRKWEAALDGKGVGLVQTSTDMLQGRKLFMWGNGSGGKHWQEFLAEPGKAYLEVQAGLANTQMEHLPMPAGAQWEWLEAYGRMDADPVVVHGDNWQQAYSHVEERLEAILPRELLDKELARLDKELDQEGELRTMGSGWGALELIRRQESATFSGERALFLENSLDEEQKPWLALLKTGSLPTWDPSLEPAAYLTQTEWRTLLEDSIAAGKSAHWHGYLQLGVQYCAAGEMDNAKEAFEASLQQQENGWAERNLAALAVLSNQEGEVVKRLLHAFALLPILPIAIECGNALIHAKEFGEFVAFFDRLPEDLKHHGRLRAQRIQAAIELDELDIALQMLSGEQAEVWDMREGEILLSDLWIQLHAKKIAARENLPLDDSIKARVLKEYPIPKNLDFRMNTER